MRLSLQLFTVRDAMASDPEGTLSAISDMGLEYVELAGTYDKPAAEFADLLSRHNLKPSGTHNGIESLEQTFEAVVADNKSLGNEWVIVPWIPEERRKWSDMALGLNKIGEKLAAEGLKLAYHNHDFELKADKGLRRLVAETVPASVAFQIDLGWVQYAGEDPANLLYELSSRVPLVHLKDMAPDRENPHVVAGDGAVNWDEVLAVCEGTGVQFGAIEMDLPPNDPIEDVRTCVKYFQARGLR